MFVFSGMAQYGKYIQKTLFYSAVCITCYSNPFHPPSQECTKPFMEYVVI